MWMKRSLPSWFPQVIGSLAIGLTICIGAFWLVTQKHEQSHAAIYKSTLEVSRLLTDGLENQLILAFKISEMALSRMASDWKTHDICEIDPSEAPTLKAISVEFGTEGILAVIDTSGRILCSNLSLAPGGVWVADRDYFKAAVEASPDSIVFGAPILGRISGEWSLPIARRISDVDGAFAGVMYTAIPISFFLTQFEAVRPGVNGSVTLYDFDKRLLARAPSQGTSIGTVAAQAVIWQHFPAVRRGNLEGIAAATDGVRRIASFTQVGSYPLVVAVAASTGDALAQWQREVQTDQIMLLIASLLVLTVSALQGWRLHKLHQSRQISRAARDDAEKSASEARRLAAVAEAASRAKTLMLARFSHEFRTPLNAVLGFSEMTRLGLSGPISDRARENLGIVHSAGEHLNRMIGTLLDLSRIELSPSALEKERYNLNHALRDAVSMVQADARAKSIQIQVAAPEVELVAHIDPTRIVQVLVNLLSNAIRHSPAGGLIVVSLVAEGHGPIFRVEDRGTGIQTNRLSSIFEPFGGEDPNVARPDGTGLGLAISRQIMVAHGGNLTLENREGGGCCALATLPSTNDNDTKSDLPLMEERG
jgi:signal transduction histidine kinase